MGREHISRLPGHCQLPAAIKTHLVPQPSEKGLGKQISPSRSFIPSPHPTPIRANTSFMGGSHPVAQSCRGREAPGSLLWLLSSLSFFLLNKQVLGLLQVRREQNVLQIK